MQQSSIVQHTKIFTYRINSLCVSFLYAIFCVYYMSHTSFKYVLKVNTLMGLSIVYPVHEFI